MTEAAAAARVPERRTFAIISHPDAGKTTLTEKLLYCAGAIHEAGEVRARGQQRRARSDWMAIEQCSRGICPTRRWRSSRRKGNWRAPLILRSTCRHSATAT